MSASEVKEMLINKAERKQNLVKTAMENVDTVVFKYSVGKGVEDQDPNFMVYRAAGVHLYYAEILARLVGGNSKLKGLTFINNGFYNNDSKQMGVRGRVGFADGDEAIFLRTISYEHDPETNDVIGFKNTPSPESQSLYLEEKILEERAREMAYEGERFYDLMRIAMKRDDPAFLADKVAAKFTGTKREEIRQILMNMDNWYIPLFE
jgi:hypothetical protein